MKLKPGDRAADYASPIPPVNVARLGYKAVARYINGQTTHWKVLTPAERDELHANGLGIWLVFERNIERPLGGYRNGLEDGKLAARSAGELGYPVAMPIIVAFDIDVYRANIQACIDYFRGFDEMSVNPLGVYGDWDIIEALKAKSVLNWQANARAWSASRVHPLTHLHQRTQVALPGLGALDPNDVLRDIDAWLPDVHADEQEKDMEYVLIDVEDSHCVLIGKRDRNGLILEAEWTGPGGDPKVQARLSFLRGAGVETVSFPISSLAYVTLIGPLPYGDPGRDWHEGLFFRVVV